MQNIRSPEQNAKRRRLRVGPSTPRVPLPPSTVRASKRFRAAGRPAGRVARASDRQSAPVHTMNAKSPPKCSPGPSGFVRRRSSYARAGPHGNARDASESMSVCRRSNIEHRRGRNRLFFGRFLIAAIITIAVRGDSLRATASTSSSTVGATCNPSVTKIHPSRGPAAGGTLLTVYGRCLDAGARVLIGELNSTCTMVTRDRERVTCVTRPADGDAVAGGRVRVVFDDGRTATYTARPFAYVAVDANQTFGGIASGGTVFWVRGRFPRNRTARATVGDAAGQHYDGECVVRNDTHMSCRSPCTRDADRLRVTLPLTFRDEFVFAPPAGWDRYRPYPDPSVADFTVDDDGRVTVSGRDLLDVGYSRTDDLSVSALLPDAADTSVACNVSDVLADRIVCRLPPSTGPQHRQPFTVTVRIGDNFAVNVSHRAPARFSHSPRTVSYLPGVAVTAVYVLFVPVLCAALFSLRTLRNSGTAHTYDLLTLERRRVHTTMRPLNDDAAAADPLQTPPPPENPHSS